MRLRALVRDDELLGRTHTERVGDRVLLPFQFFARRQAAGGLLLLVCAVLALGWANSPWADVYERLLHVPLGISAGLELPCLETSGPRRH
jgi:NhaA family Na+:H+ antiporter